MELRSKYAQDIETRQKLERYKIATEKEPEESSVKINVPVDDQQLTTSPEQCPDPAISNRLPSTCKQITIEKFDSKKMAALNK